METRKYPLTDEIKELTTDALAELAEHKEWMADSFVRLNTHESIRRAEELMEYAADLRKASDYYMNL